MSWGWKSYLHFHIKNMLKWKHSISYLILRKRNKYQLLSDLLDNWIKSLITRQLSWPDEHDSELITSADCLMVNHCLFLCLGIDSVMHRQSCGIFIESPSVGIPINTGIYELVCNIFYLQLLPGGHLVKSVRQNSHWAMLNLLVIEVQDKDSSLIN